MSIRGYKPTTPSRRHMTNSTFSEITTSTPEKSLLVSIKKTVVVTIMVASQHAISEVDIKESTESLISREIKMIS